MTEPPKRPQTPQRNTAHEIERYGTLFAQRTKVMRSSAMRDLMAITERPEVISLAGGLPDTASFPASSFAAIMQSIASGSHAQALQYGPTEGELGCKQAAATVMAAEGIDVDPQQLLITTGGQQALDLLGKALLDPGDIVLAEAPTYPGAIPVFCSYQAEVVQIEVDEDGINIELLSQQLLALKQQNRKPKFIYTVPNFQNPAGVTLSLQRRRRLVELAREHEILIVEDNPYGLLRYEGLPLPSLYSIDGGEYVAYVGTFSKILSPGLRVGWLATPQAVMQKLNIGKQAADLCSSSLTQMFVGRYFQQCDWQEYLESLIDIYRARRDTMLTALGEYFPNQAEWTTPGGGLFVWATLPDYIDTTDLLARALRENVAFVPGRAAYLDGRGGSSLRLNFSGVDEPTIEEGIKRIGKVIGEQLGLYGTLTQQSLPKNPGDTQPQSNQPQAEVVQLDHLDSKRRGTIGNG